MPINFLTNRRRAQRLGRVRLGIKKTNEWGKEYPSATPYFVLKDAPTLLDFYGEQPTQLNIEFLWDDIHMTFPHYMRRYSSSGLRCLGDGDAILYRVNEKGDVDVRDGNATQPGGKVVMGDDNQPIKVACLGEQCPHYLDGSCKPTGFLCFLPIQAPRLGYYDMVCHQRAIVGIKTQLELARGIFHHITGIPFVLHRGDEERVPVKIPGKGMVDMPIRTQWIEIEPAWFAEHFPLRDKHRALAQAKVRQDVIELFGEDDTSDEVALVPAKIDEFKRPLFNGETGEILDPFAEAECAADEPLTPPKAKLERPATVAELEAEATRLGIIAEQAEQPLRAGKAKWYNCTNIINRAREEIPYYEDNAPHIIATLSKLEEEGVITWDATSVDDVFDALNKYASQRANEKATKE